MIRAETIVPKLNEIPRHWHLMDAQGQILGRLATRVALLLRGKHKPIFTPHMDCGDNVVVINAEKIQVTGTKMETKIYQRYSGYPSGLKKEPLQRLLARRPTEVVRRAVVGMLPNGPLGNRVVRRLYIYAGGQHPHGAQLKLPPVKK